MFGIVTAENKFYSVLNLNINLWAALSHGGGRMWPASCPPLWDLDSYLEVDGEEHLPVVDGVHAAAVEELRGDGGVHVGQEEECVHRVLLGDDVHELDLRRRLRLHADPGDLHRRVLALVGGDLSLDAGEDVVAVDLR